MISPYHEIKCDGPLCNSPANLKKADKPTSKTINFVTVEYGVSVTKYGWSAFLTPFNSKNYFFCPRCTEVIKFRMNLDMKYVG